MIADADRRKKSIPGTTGDFFSAGSLNRSAISEINRPVRRPRDSAMWRSWSMCGDYPAAGRPLSKACTKRRMSRTDATKRLAATTADPIDRARRPLGGALFLKLPVWSVNMKIVRCTPPRDLKKSEKNPLTFHKL